MGSSKAVPMNRNWRALPGVRWRVVHDSDGKVPAWQEKVKSAAQTAMFGLEPMRGPVMVAMTFTLPRPPSVPEKKRPYPCVAPDLDKLARAVGDALTGVVYVDDSLIVNLHLYKRYGTPGVVVTIGEIGEEETT
jgi:crossover junction endodeoxyribonuclease RusA